MSDIRTVDLPRNRWHMLALVQLQDAYQQNYDRRQSERSRVLALLLNQLLTDGGMTVEYAREIAAADETDFITCWTNVVQWAQDANTALATLERVTGKVAA